MCWTRAPSGKAKTVHYPYDHPGIYAIHIAGRLDESWADRLGGLQICQIVEEGNGEESRTVLKGRLPDQAALLGVINTLYNARFPILFVSFLRVAPAECSADS